MFSNTRTMGKQIKVLKHKAHMLTQTTNRRFCWLMLRVASIVTSPTRIVPLSGLLQEINAAQQRRFPRNRWDR